MQTIKLLFTLIFAALCQIIFAQKAPIEKNSLGVGLNTGLAVVENVGNTSPIGLNLNHQGNGNNWFSFRTGLSVNYFFPISETSVNYNYDPNSFAVIKEVTTERSFTSLNLSLTPLFYYRSQRYNFFVGPLASLGVQFQTYKRAELRGNFPVQGQESTIENTSNSVNQEVGAGGRIGVAYKLGGLYKGGELEASILVAQYFSGNEFDLSPDYLLIGIQLAYRFNFKR